MSAHLLGINNLYSMFKKADAVDMAEGLLAYQRYNEVMKKLSMRYQFPIDIVTEVFVTLSPNNDYYNNLRSTVTVLDAINRGIPEKQCTVSTYNHCRKRAFAYAKRERFFLNETKGLKVLNFYNNILYPNDNRWVTIDGHMSATWQGKMLTMKDAIVRSRKEYVTIAAGIKAIAFDHFMLPNQVQAIIWFTRKRIFKIKFDGQLNLFGERDDQWGIYKAANVSPYLQKE